MEKFNLEAGLMFLSEAFQFMIAKNVAFKLFLQYD